MTIKQIYLTLFIMMLNKSNLIFCAKLAGIKPIIQKIYINSCKDDLNMMPQENERQYLIKNKEQEFLFIGDETQKQLYMNNNEFLKDKKLISISPGGYSGFYQMGICSFIKDNYNLENYIFSGASAGAWNSLFMTFKKDQTEFALKILSDEVMMESNILDIELKIKKVLLREYANDDFDFKRLFVGVTTINKLELQTNIFSDFDNLEDAIDCCIASSHIPFITGPFTNSYHNMRTYDGGFSKYPYLNLKKSVLHITPNTMKNVKKSKFCFSQLYDYINQFQKKNHDCIGMYDNGYNNARENRDKLNKIFLQN